jgi:hypothetical protein
MSRTAETLYTVKPPKDLPAGCELIQSERTLSGADAVKDADGKSSKPKAVVTTIVPISGNAEGLRNWIELRSKLGKAAKVENGSGEVREDLGVVDAINAIRSASFNIVSKLTLETAKVSDTFLLPFAGPRTVNPFEAVTAAIAAFQRENSRMPNAKEYQDIADAYMAMTG